MHKPSLKCSLQQNTHPANTPTTQTQPITQRHPATHPICSVNALCMTVPPTSLPLPRVPLQLYASFRWALVHHFLATPLLGDSRPSVKWDPSFPLATRSATSMLGGSHAEKPGPTLEVQTFASGGKVPLRWGSKPHGFVKYRAKKC